MLKVMKAFFLDTIHKEKLVESAYRMHDKRTKVIEESSSMIFDQINDRSMTFFRELKQSRYENDKGDTPTINKATTKSSSQGTKDQPNDIVRAPEIEIT